MSTQAREKATGTGGGFVLFLLWLILVQSCSAQTTIQSISGRLDRIESHLGVKEEPDAK